MQKQFIEFACHKYHKYINFRIKQGYQSKVINKGTGNSRKDSRYAKVTMPKRLQQTILNNQCNTWKDQKKTVLDHSTKN